MGVIGIDLGTTNSAMAKIDADGRPEVIVGLTGAIEIIRKITPRAVIRGVQLSTGALLISGGVKFITGKSTFQALQNAGEPYLALQAIGPVPIGIVIGLVGGCPEYSEQRN